jgi:ABC-type sugar transport system permease subunit
MRDETTTTVPVAIPATATDTRRAAGMRRQARRETLAGYLFLSPAIILYVVFIAAPLVGAIILSLFQWDLLTPAKFVGLHNYRDLLHDQVARQSVINSFIFTFWSIVLHLGFGLALALAVNRAISPFLRYFLRTAYFFPLLISWAAVALMWLYILDPNFGFFSYYARQLGWNPPAFLVSPHWAMPAVIMVDLWRTLGFTFIILLAGLQGVPRQLHEAAMIDGAGTFNRFWNVTIPMLSPTLFFVLVMNFIGAFQIFEPMFIMTNGGPGDSTISIVMHIYETGFRSFQMGLASALAMVVFVVIMIVTLIQLRISKLWVFYD